jgi:hypothetical protein
VPTTQPTSAPIVSTNISISMSTEISNITAVDFDATAFSSAVIDVAAAVVPAPALPSLQVVLIKDPSVTVATAKSKRRRLQAVPNSVTVAYDVHNLPDVPTAIALQQHMTSADGDTSLLNSYKALSDTAATAATTTAIKLPPVPPVHTSVPVGVIAGSVVGGVVVLVSAAALTVWCQKRRVATRRRELLRKAVADNRTALYSRGSSNSKRSNSGSSSNSGSTTTAAAPHPLRHSSAHRFGSMLQAIESDSVAFERDTSTASAVDVEQGVSSGNSSGGVRNSTSVEQARSVQAPLTAVGASTVQQQQQQSAAARNSNTNTTTASNTWGASGTVRPAVALPAATIATAATVAAGDNTTDSRAAAAKQSQLVSKQGWTRRLSTHITSAARQGVREHGEKAVVAWEGIGKGNNHS